MRVRRRPRRHIRSFGEVTKRAWSPHTLPPMDSVRVARVRSGYQYLKDGDIPRLLDLFHDDVELVDPFYNTVLRGRQELVELWQSRQVVDHSLVIGDIIEMGDAVIVVVHHDFYQRDQGRIGAGVDEVHRFTFRDDRVAGLDITTLDAIPEDLRRLLT